MKKKAIYLKFDQKIEKYVVKKTVNNLLFEIGHELTQKQVEDLCHSRDYSITIE